MGSLPNGISAGEEKVQAFDSGVPGFRRCFNRLFP